MTIVDNAKRWVRRPFDFVGGEWNRLAPRERRLVTGLVAAVVGFVVLVAGYLIVDSLRSVAEANDDAREALEMIAKNRDEYLEAKARMVALEVRIGTEPPQLAADLETAAREVGIQLPDMADRPPAAVGRHYLEHNVDVKLRQVDLQSLSKFLAKLETSRRLIVITRLSIRRSYSEGDKLIVELTATSYERVKETRKKPATKAKGA
jgi:type II secretory pathway component PulM